MKPFALASLALAALIAVPPSMANDSDQAASDVSSYTAIAAIAVPVYVGAAAAYYGSGLVAGTGHQLVRLVEKSGEGLSDLTADGLEQLYRDHPDAISNVTHAPTVTVDHKEIPLVVRKDYVEMNEKVKLR